MGVKVRSWKGAWWLFVDSGGRRKAKRIGTGPAGKLAAEYVAAQVAVKVAEGRPWGLDGAPSVPTFALAAAQWAPWYAGLYPTRDATKAHRASFLTHHLIPWFGTKPITDVTRAEIQKFLSAKRAYGGSIRVTGKPLTDSSIKVGLVGLRLILDYAVERGWLTSNPMRGAKLWRPIPSAAAADPFDQRELAAILDAAEAIRPSFGLLVRVAVQSGLRSGELRGLTFGDLNAEAGTVEVRASLDRRGQRGPTKTTQSKRTASVCYPVCEATPSYMAGSTPESRSVVTRLRQVTPLDVTAPLFPARRHPMRPMATGELRSLWDRAIRKARVRPRPPHMLRDTLISVLLSRGCPLLQVSAQVGDSLMTIARHYAKFLPALPGATPAQPGVVRRAAHR